LLLDFSDLMVSNSQGMARFFALVQRIVVFYSYALNLVGELPGGEQLRGDGNGAKLQNSES
jgi:hypothetical protein